VTPRKVDVRVIAATNRDVQDLIAQKQFREDLYYRLAMVELRTPALADRREDLPLLEKFLLDRFAAQFNKDIRGLTRRAQIVLARHSWPGNIRELENALGNACMMAIGDMVDVEDLPASLRQHERTVGAAAGNSHDLEQLGESVASAPGVSFDDHEKGLLADALERSGGNQSEAARLLRISRDRLRYKMAKYNLR
jgi:DNA-binding NtrC family response regulator